MKVLHMCSYFNTSTLYEYLFTANKKNGIEQKVIIPMYVKQELIKEYGTVRKYKENEENLEYDYLRILKKYQRPMLYSRIRSIFTYIYKHYQLDDYDLVHAHSLLLNGTVARYIKRKKGIPYIAAVRNTDLEVLTKYPIFRRTAIKTIEEASYVIFISKSLKKRFIENTSCWKDIYESKADIIPNGINDDWYEINYNHHIFDSNNIKFLYQGTLLERKRVDYVISLICKLREYGFNCKYSIYGEGPCKEYILKRIENENLSEFVKCDTWLNDYDKIKNNYVEADVFIMPSYNETFGISYIESLACYTPIIYTANDGIDGMVSENQGVAITGKDLYEDVHIISDMLQNYDIYKRGARERLFRWSDISAKYKLLYEMVNDES